MIHLHVHSMYSLRDSIIKPDELVEKLKSLKQDAVAITDHGTALGSVEIYKLLKKNNIKYIHGCEMYICDDTSIKDKSSKYHHLVVLCKNEVGRLNLNKLMSLSNNPENFYSKPRIDIKLLSQYKEGLIVLSACLAGEVSRLIEGGDIEAAKNKAIQYKELMGDDYYLEIQSHLDETQISVNKTIVGISKELNIPCVVTTDAHFVKEDDRKYQNKYAFNGAYKEDGESYIDCHIQSEQEVREKLYYLDKSFIDELIDNTHKIANMCNVSMPLSAPIMPVVDTPEEYKNNKEWLITLCVDGFKSKLNIDYNSHSMVDESKKLKRPIWDDDLDEIIGWEEYQLSSEQIEEYIDRFHYELNSLEKMGFIDYILLVYSYANKGSRRGIARGSGGGSLINYLTNITDIDPIEHGLYFERFIDVGALDLLEKGKITPEELKVPDIDLDFSGDSCKEVLHWLYDRYGEDKVASIGKYGTNKTKGTIRDMCKVLDIDLSTADIIAKAFENYEISEIDNMLDGDIDREASAETAIEMVCRYPELFEYVRKLCGLPKSFGLHACGKIVATQDLDYYLPSCYDEDGIRYLQGDKHSIEDVGLVKIDVLGLRTIDQEYDTLEQSKESVDFINPKQDYHDERVLDIFRKGDTLGIFQMSSPGMRQTLKKMDVRGINDLSVANALFRPGSISYIDNFCNRRKGTEEFEFLHPDLEPILKDTYGIMVFQEQLIEIGRMAKIHNPDDLRRATAKKEIDLLNQVKPELEEKLKTRGWTQEQFNQLWADMLEFAKYSFNKAHSSAYAIIAYNTAKQKAYYPAEFYSGLCNSYLGESSFVKDNAEEIARDMDNHNVILQRFDWRQDHRRCSVVNGKVLYAIPLIRDCNDALANALYEISTETFDTFSSLIIRLSEFKVTKKQIDILVKLGFFSQYGNSKELLRIVEVLEEFKHGQTVEYSKEKATSNRLVGLLSKYCIETKSKYKFSNDEIKEIEGLNRLLQKQLKIAPETEIEKLNFQIQKNKDKISVIRQKIYKPFFVECEEYIKSLGVYDFSFKEKMAIQLENLGFVNITTNKEEDRQKLIVSKIIPLKNRSTGNLFAYMLVTKSVGSGKNSSVNVMSEVFESNPIYENDVIYIRDRNTDMYQKKKGYWYLRKYERIIS